MSLWCDVIASGGVTDIEEDVRAFGAGIGCQVFVGAITGKPSTKLHAGFAGSFQQLCELTLTK